MIVDITEKLKFDENPKLKIKGEEYEVNADAVTVLKIMGIAGEGNTTPKGVMEMYNLLFQEKARKKIEKMKLSFHDFKMVVESAVNLACGEDGNEESDPGER